MKKAWLIVLVVCVASCSPTLPTYEVKFSGNTIQVPVNNFENSTFNVVSDNTAPFDILLVKENPGAYHSLYLKCTNDEKQLDPTPAEIVCPVCNSRYDFDGMVTNGPAETQLTRFNTELNMDKTLVTINIEALGR
jgi:hypothetical protein